MVQLNSWKICLRISAFDRIWCLIDAESEYNRYCVSDAGFAVLLEMIEVTLQLKHKVTALYINCSQTDKAAQLLTSVKQPPTPTTQILCIIMIREYCVRR